MDRCGYDALWVGDHIAFAVPIRDPSQQLAQACFDGSIVALDGAGEHNANNLGIRLGRRQIRSADAQIHGSIAISFSGNFHRMSDTRVITLECFLMLAGLLRCEPDMGDEDLIEIRSTNLCRRTGCQGIVAAVCAALAAMREA